MSGEAVNICQVMAGDDDGGLETHFVQLSNGLAALDDQVTAIAHQRYAAGFSADVRFVPLDLTRGRRNPLLRRRLRQLVDAAAPDVVHGQGGKAAALLAAVRPAAPLVGTIHNVKSDLSVYRAFDAVIGVSAGVLDGLNHPCQHVVYNGVQPPPPAIAADELRRRFAIPRQRTVTLATGRLVPAKAYPHLIDLWDESLGHLLIVGDGPQRATLNALTAGKPVTLPGFQADARALMGAADLMVFASEREGFSYAMAEALRARLPVVSTPVPGARDVLPPSHLAPLGDLKAAIAFCLADLDAARQRMQRTFDWAEQTLTVERMVQATRAVYQGLAT